MNVYGASAPLPLTRAEVVGMILAGGQSRRMQGVEGVPVNKATLPWGKARVIDVVLSRIEQQCHQVLINSPVPLPGLEQFVHLPDQLHINRGPLSGLLSGLQYLKAFSPDTPWLLTVPCDTPFIPNDLVETFGAALHGNPEKQVAVAKTNERLHPVIGLWHLDTLSGLEHWLSQGHQQVHRWVEKIGGLQVSFPQEGAFANLNTPEEYERWSKHAST